MPESKKFVFSGDANDLLVSTEITRFKDLAEKLGITRQYLSNVLSGKRPMTELRVKQLERLITDENYKIRELLEEV